jgi:hypothetical protein
MPYGFRVALVDVQAVAVVHVRTEIRAKPPGEDLLEASLDFHGPLFA